MPVKRRLGKQGDGAITPQAVAAYEHALAMRKRADRSGSDEDAAVAHEAERVIDRMFQIRLWMISIWDVQRYSPHPGNADWERAADIKRRLDEALVAVRAKQTTPAVPAPTEDAEAEAPVPADADP